MRCNSMQLLGVCEAEREHLHAAPGRDSRGAHSHPLHEVRKSLQSLYLSIAVYSFCRLHSTPLHSTLPHPSTMLFSTSLHNTTPQSTLLTHSIFPPRVLQPASPFVLLIAVRSEQTRLCERRTTGTAPTSPLWHHR